jgi:hypothetical protein
VRGEEAAARKSGFGNEERDVWGLGLGLGLRFLRFGWWCCGRRRRRGCWIAVGPEGKLGWVQVGYAAAAAGGGGSGVSVYDALELA